MKNLKYSPKFDKEYRKLIKNNPSLIAKISKTLSYLSHDPAHPSLRLHKVGGSEIFSVSVTMDIRIKVFFQVDSVLLLSIRHHDDSYRS